MGRIADIAKSEIPVTWDGLTNDDRIGDTTLTARESYVHQLIFGDDLSEGDQNALPPLVAQYAGKKLALEVIEVAYEFWMVQSETATTRQPLEIESFPDRLKYLDKKKASLLVDLAELSPIVTPLIPTLFARAGGSAPLLSSIDTDLLTPDPQDFGPIYAPPEA